MIEYERTAEPRSHQLQLPNMDEKGEKHVNDLMEWIDGNTDAMTFMVSLALQRAQSGRVSAKQLVEDMRAHYRVTFNNNWTAALARVLENMFPETLGGKFRMRKAKSDGYVS